MKQLVLSEKHSLIGGKMVNFAGFNMPVQYEGVNIEHETVRNSVGVFDVSHMGQIIVKGNRSEEFLQYVTSNDISKLSPGKIQYAYIPNESGGVVDDLLVYQLEDNSYMLVVNASNIEKDWEWLNKHNNFDVQLINESDNFSILAIQGPKTIDLLQQLTEVQLDNVRYYHFVRGSISGVNDITISRTGYTGELGFELYIKNKDVEKVWEALFSTNIDLKPIGLAARDTLRLEKGYCLYGNDINDTTSPIEAGLGWITRFSKKFINDEYLLKQKEEGVDRVLIGLVLQERGIARKDYIIVSEEKQEIGIITSGTMSPTLKKSIALGYVETRYSRKDSEIYIHIRNKYIKALVIELPFVK